MKRCPKCFGTEFEVTAHVTQDWLVDGEGYCKKVMTSCVEVTHTPDDDDIWNCARCGHSAPGREFNIPDETGAKVLI